MAQSMERKVLQEFIEIYHNESALWKTKSCHYNNKSIKAAAYHRLQMKLRELYPEADLDMVKKKINALRTNFRKEQRKVEASRERSLQTGEPVYVPSLWYYGLFHFIADQETDKADSEVDGSIDVQNMLSVGLDENVGYFDGEESDDNFDDEFQVSSPESQKMNDNSSHMPSSMTSMNDRRSMMMMDMEHQGFKRKRENNNYNNMMTSWYPRQEQMNPYARTVTLPPTSETDIFGRYVASKLKKMDKPMKMLSERLISEILFQGEMGCLNTTTNISRGDRVPNKEEPTSS